MIAYVESVGLTFAVDRPLPRSTSPPSQGHLAHAERGNKLT
jgi:hypothetical protein